MFSIITWDLNDWELDLVVNFLHILESNIPSTENGDCMKWKLKKNGDFDICLLYIELQGPLSIVFSWKGVWKVKAPHWVPFFVWAAAWDKIVTGDNLKIRGFAFVDWCVMCNCCEEIVDHLLLHCEKAHRLWCFVFSILWESVGFTKKGTWSSFGWWNWLGKHSSDIWNLVLLWLKWCTWRERNRWMLEDVDSSDDQLLASFSGSLFDWSQLTGLETNI